MSSADRADRFCVIGAGPAGLTAVKNLLRAGVPVEGLEREDDVGGNWYFGRPGSSIYQSTHLISSKRLTQFADFPMPTEFPDFPHHAQALAYLRNYARHFGLYEHFLFNTTVERAEPIKDGPGWHVKIAGESTPRRYAGVIVCNGHHWDPKLPQIPGQFVGEILHAHDYKSPDVLRGKRVLVVGAGNSGCDIAVEASQHASATFLSMRRGYYFVPKFIRGEPSDEAGHLLHVRRFPLWLRRWLSLLALRIIQGNPYRKLGLPKPDHKLFETHPIINTQLMYHLGHGDLKIKPDVKSLQGSEVEFVDGTRQPIDLIVYATGYRVSFPFIDGALLNENHGVPQLYLHTFHPQRDDLFVVGMIQPDAGSWGLFDFQAQLVACYLRALRAGDSSAAWFAKLKSGPNPRLGSGIRYLHTDRHALEVEYFSYRKRLKNLVRQFKQPGFPCGR